jgi:ABC-type spermidine/putrescine transport system permease subunit II
MSNQLKLLQPQQEIAKCLGASSFQIWKDITLPQIFPLAFQLGGILALWSLGDFALSKMIFNHDATLAMHIESLMSSYRIDAAMSLMALLLFLGIIIYTFFWSLSYVVSRRS